MPSQERNIQLSNSVFISKGVIVQLYIYYTCIKTLVETCKTCTVTFPEEITECLSSKVISITFLLQQNNTMKFIHRALFVVFALILFHLLICSPLSLHCWRNTHPRVRNQPRRLLGSFVSISSNLNKLSGAIQDPKKAVEPSLRKAPPSDSNPTQNK